MLRSLTSLAVLATCVSVPGIAMAQSFDYTYFEGHYGRIDIDDSDLDGDGFGFGGSLALTDNFHLFGSYMRADLDFGFDITEWDAGIGFNTPLTRTVDVLARLAYVSAELDLPAGVGGGSIDNDGYSAGVGLRIMATRELELHGRVNYVDFGGSSGDDTSFGAGLLYHFNDTFAVGVSGERGDINRYRLTGRISFGM